MTNWRDGGGFYPPGSDTPNAPWNQKDLEVEDRHEEQARNEIEELLLWEESHDFYEWSDQLQTVVPHQWFTQEHLDLIENIEVTADSHGMRRAMFLINEEQKGYIEKCIADWIEERAEDIAREEYFPDTRSGL